MPTEEQRAYYAQRATDLRKMAKKARDADIRETLMEMAGSYETLVQEADRIARLRGRIPET